MPTSESTLSLSSMINLIWWDLYGAKMMRFWPILEEIRDISCSGRSRVLAIPIITSLLWRLTPRVWKIPFWSEVNQRCCREHSGPSSSQSPARQSRLFLSFPGPLGVYRNPRLPSTRSWRGILPFWRRSLRLRKKGYIFTQKFAWINRVLFDSREPLQEFWVELVRSGQRKTIYVVEDEIVLVLWVLLKFLDDLD